jgi:folate-dependent tRNA-U54 methylase TrmFO/GidA
MKIELHIDRLVVDAGSAAAIDRERLAQAVSQALAQRVDAGAARQPAVQQGPAREPGLEHRIAAALHQALPAAARGGRP